MKPTSLLRQITLPSILALLVFASGIGYFTYELVQHTHAIETNILRLRQIQFQVHQINTLFSELERRILSFHFAPSDESVSEMSKTTDEIARVLSETTPLILTYQARELIGELRNASAGAKRTWQAHVEAVKARDQRTIQSSFVQWTIRSQYLRAALNDLNSYTTLGMAAEFEDFEDRQVHLSIVLLGLLTVAGVTIAFFTYYIYRIVARPLISMTRAAERITRSEKSEMVLGENRSDEIGILAQTLNRMTKRLTSTNEELKEAIQIRDNFMSIASHELRTPLTSLLLHSQLLGRSLERAQDEEALRKQVRGASEIIQRQLKRLQFLISDLLDVTRIRAGKMNYRFIETDLNALVRQVLRDQEDDLAAARCQLLTSLQDPLIGEWDPLRLEQLVVNLITNAIKYAAGSVIRVETWCENEHAVLKVQDFGPGIPKQDQMRIFDRFERGTPHSRTEGLGLGLFIVKNIVEGHRGTVQLESDSGAGTLFTITLPLRQI